jgi:hypothetical protein
MVAVELRSLPAEAVSPGANGRLIQGPGNQDLIEALGGMGNRWRVGLRCALSLIRPAGPSPEGLRGLLERSLAPGSEARRRLEALYAQASGGCARTGTSDERRGSGRRKTLAHVIEAILILGCLGALVWGLGAARLSWAALIWGLCNALLTLIACLGARARPRTVILASLLGPLTVFIPVLGSGMLSAWLEFRFSPPSPTDAARILQDSRSLRAARGNSALRPFLVYAFAAVGNALANLIGLGLLSALALG